ncbi:MAG: sigma-70 family RNA polymerase sigma factor [Deltaproteobacteria bacterium]|nr:sigma-70 family RNA polymerase sigma factor [Deltaproteobacteria bacterium]
MARDPALEQRLTQSLTEGRTRDAVADAIRGYGPQILGWLVVVHGDEDEAADVFAAFAEDVVTGIESFRGASSFRVWAYAVAWRASQRYRRDAFRRHTRGLMTSEASQLAEEVRSSLGTRLDRSARVARLREQLSPEDQALITLRFDRELSWTEVAEALSAEGEVVTEAALRKRFERLKDTLRALEADASAG